MKNFNKLSIGVILALTLGMVATTLSAESMKCGDGKREMMRDGKCGDDKKVAPKSGKCGKGKCGDN